MHTKWKIIYFQINFAFFTMLEFVYQLFLLFNAVHSTKIKWWHLRELKRFLKIAKCCALCAYSTSPRLNSNTLLVSSWVISPRFRFLGCSCWGPAWQASPVFAARWHIALRKPLRENWFDRFFCASTRRPGEPEYRGLFCIPWVPFLQSRCEVLQGI